MAAAKKPASLAERIAHAQSLSINLNASTDALNASIEKIQGKFRELDLGVEASVDMTTAEESEDDRWRRLWFSKEGNSWHFTVVNGRDDDPMTAHSTMLLKASRAWRLQAARLMPELLEELISRAEGQVDEVLQAALQLDSLTDTIDTAIRSNRRQKIGGGPVSLGEVAAGVLKAGEP